MQKLLSMKALGALLCWTVGAAWAQPPAPSPSAAGEAAPPAVPAAPVPAENLAGSAPFARLLAVLYGEAEESSAGAAGGAGTGAESPKPPRLTGAAAKAEPLFAQAAARRQTGDVAGAREIYHQILALPRLDSRRALRAWKGLREAGEPAAGAAAGQILGVVAEIDYDVQGEHAILAVSGYAEGDPILAASSGYSLLGVRLRSSTIAAGRRLVTAAQPFLAEVPPEEIRRLPGNGEIRLSLLTPGGVRSIALPRRELEAAPTSLHPLYVAAQQLLVALRLESERLEDAKKP